MSSDESGAGALSALASSISGDGEFRLLFDQAPVAMHEIDSRGILTRVNQTECELLGWTQEELLGRPVWELVDPAEREASRIAVLAKLACPDPVPVLHRRYQTRHGRRLEIELHENKILDATGAVLGIRTVLIDVTARRELERRLAESERRFRNVVEGLGEGICVVDQNERVTFANPAADQIFGLSPGALLGRSLREFVDQEEWAAIVHQSEMRSEGLTSTYELGIRRPSGEIRTLLVTGSPHENAEGERIETFGILRDILRIP